MATKASKGMSSTLARAKTGGRGGGVVEAMRSRAAAADESRMVPVEDIQPNPDNPAERSVPGEGLVASVREVGVIQDLVLVPLEQWLATHPQHAEVLTDQPYVTLAGHRRHAAARVAERDTVPARVRTDLDATTLDSIVLHENLHREALTPVEEAHAYRRILERQGISQRALARHTGVSQSQISKKLRLLDLPEELQEAVNAGLVGVEAAGAVVGEDEAVVQLVAEAVGAAEEGQGIDLPAVVNDARRVVQDRALRAAAEQEASDRGATFVSHEDLDQHPALSKAGRWEHRVTSEKAIAKAQEAGTLLVSHGRSTPWGGEPEVEFYTTEAPPSRQQEQPARSESTHQRIKANKARRAVLPDLTTTPPPVETIRSQLLAWALTDGGWGSDVYKVAGPLLTHAGLVPEGTEPYEIRSALADLPEKRGYHAAWILLVARREVEAGMPDHTGRGWGRSHIEHYAWLTEHGYAPSEWEQEQLHAAHETISKEHR